MSTSYNLGTVSASSTKTPETQINEVIAKTQAAINELSTEVSTSNSNSAMLRYQVPIASGVQTGHLVYWVAGTSTSSSDGYYDKALAELSGDNGSNGASVETAKSHVEGIIIETNSDGSTYTGTLLVGGSWVSTAAMTTCLQSSSAVQGIYYLSPTTPGTAVPATDTYGKLQQGLLAYHGGGSFTLNLFYQANDHHYHGSEWLDVSNWTTVTGSSYTKPEAWTNAMWYDGSTDTQFKTAGPLSSDVTTIFHNGSIEKLGSGTASNFYIDADGVLWYNGSTAPSGNCAMFNHFPFAYGSPVVRSIQTEGSLISAVNNNGIVTISQDEYTTGASGYYNSAIHALTSGIAYRTPVVSNVIAGAGINVYKASDGQVTVSTSNLIGSPIDAYGITHNGTVMTSNGIYQYITFPANRSASIVISMPVTGISSSTSLRAICWGELEGNIGASFNVVSNFIPLPTAGAGSYDSTATNTQTMTFSGGAATSGSYVEYAETASGPVITGNGMLVASVTISNPNATYAVKLLRLGFKLTVTSDVAKTDAETTSLQYVVNTQILGTSSEAAPGKCVRMTSNGLQLCKASDSTSYNTCLGVGAYSVAVNSLAYVTSGSLQLSSELFTSSEIGSPVYVGSNGVPVTTAPTSGYLQRIGTVLAADVLLVNIQQAVAIES